MCPRYLFILDFMGILTLGDEINAVFRNVGKRLPVYVAKNWYLFIITSIMKVVG